MCLLRDYSSLLASDELRKEMENGAVFAEFQEGAVTFSPTFKVARVATLQYQAQVYSSPCHVQSQVFASRRMTHFNDPHVDSACHRIVIVSCGIHYQR